MKIKIAWLLLVLGSLSGLWFLALLFYFFAAYSLCEGSSCHELLMGPAVASLFGAPSWAASSLGAFLLADQIKKTVGVTCYTLTVGMLCVIIYFSFLY